MGAGASTEFNPEAVSLGDAESSEPVDAEGYDSDLADDFRDLKAPRAKPAQGRPTVETSRGRLGPEPSGDAKRAWRYSSRGRLVPVRFIMLAALASKAFASHIISPLATAFS